MKQLVLKFPSLVRQNAGMEAKTEHEVVVKSVSYGTGSLVSCEVCMCKLGEMVHDDKNVFISTRALFLV